MMSTLTRLGIRYDSSTDGKEIIRILKEAYERGEGYDICFVNWQMPGGFGKKLVREMREIFDRDTLKSSHLPMIQRIMRKRCAGRV